MKSVIGKVLGNSQKAVWEIFEYVYNWGLLMN